MVSLGAEENPALWHFNSCVENWAMSTFSQVKWSLQVEKSILMNICTYFFLKAIHKHCYFSRIGLLLPSWLPSWLHGVTVNSYLWNFVRNHFRKKVSLSFPAIDSNNPDSCCILDEEKGLAEVIAFAVASTLAPPDDLHIAGFFLGKFLALRSSYLSFFLGYTHI